MYSSSSLLIVAVTMMMMMVVTAIPIDNGVIGLPQVDCMEDRVRLLFTTERPFLGRIFVKGMVEKEACVINFTKNKASSVTFEMTNGACNMRRARRLGPQRGVEQSMTVIISFHDTFITKVDRAFRCTCFYMEADKVVTSRFEVSMLPTTDLIDTARMPLCTYNVRRGTISGSNVAYATVGEPVYHVWECESDMFSMLVHSCFVDDGAGQQRKPLIDEKGCAIDQVILPDLTYNKQNTMAYAEVYVFKFADKVTMYFQCAVSICMRDDGACNGITPPNCGRNHHTRRLARRDASLVERAIANRTTLPHHDTDMDLAAERIVVLDIDEQAPTTDSIDKSSISNTEWSTSVNVEPFEQICLSGFGFGMLLSIFLLILLFSLTGVAILLSRNRPVPKL